MHWSPAALTWHVPASQKPLCPTVSVVQGASPHLGTQAPVTLHSSHMLHAPGLPMQLRGPPTWMEGCRAGEELDAGRSAMVGACCRVRTRECTRRATPQRTWHTPAAHVPDWPSAVVHGVSSVSATHLPPHVHRWHVGHVTLRQPSTAWRQREGTAGESSEWKASGLLARALLAGRQRPLSAA